MTVFVRIGSDGRAAEFIPEVLDGVPLADRYHPDFVAALVPKPADLDVRDGWVWDGQTFSPPPAPEAPIGPRYVPVATFRERLEAQGKWEAAVALLTPAQILKLATLREGVDADDTDVHDVLQAVGADIEAALAP